MVGVQNMTPNPHLKPFVCRYVQREHDPRLPASIEPVVARLGSMLTFQFAEQVNVPAYGVERPNFSVPAMVVGPMEARLYRVVTEGHVRTLTVLFRPLGFYRLFGVPVAPLSNTGTDAHALLGAEISALWERLANTPEFAGRVAILDAFLLGALTRRSKMRREDYLFAPLLRHGSEMTVGRAAFEAGLSVRQFERRALEYVGVSPGTMMKLQRFHRALRMKSSRRAMSWMEIAHATGYYDQMHMIRDFRMLAGGTPSEAMQQIAPLHLISFM
jgi:AraC-like DNA-binding protein